MLWELDRIFANYLLPQQNLLKKNRSGTNAAKVHDKPAAPNRRAITDPAAGKMPTIRMNASFNKNGVMALSRQILAPTARLETWSKVKGGTAHDHLSDALS